MNSHPHKLFFILLLSTPTIILSSASSDQGPEKNLIMYPNAPVTEIEPLPHLSNQNRATVSEADVNNWIASLTSQQKNAERAAAERAAAERAAAKRAAAAVKVTNDLVNAVEPAFVPMSPTKKESAKTNHK